MSRIAGEATRGARVAGQGTNPVYQCCLAQLARVEKAGRRRCCGDLRTAKIEIQEHSFQTAGKTTMNFKEGQLTISPLTLTGEGTDIAIG